MAAFAHLYSRIESLRRDTEKQSDEQVVRIEAQLTGLRTEMAQDRKEAAQAQQAIVGSMVTRGELDRQIDRIVQALNGRGNRARGHQDDVG